jgi:hypothetical protein
LLNCGFVKCGLNNAKRFLSLLGIPDRILNIELNMFDAQISFDTVHHETANYQIVYAYFSFARSLLKPLRKPSELYLIRIKRRLSYYENWELTR